MQQQINIIKQLNLDPVLEEHIVAFLETYDGTNKKETNIFMMDVILLLMNHDIVKSKAESLEKFAKIHQTYDQKLEKLKETFKRITNNEDPIEPMN
jgi:hypothetical protein